MASWFDIDLTSLQDQISNSIEEASRVIEEVGKEVGNLEILNLDALAEKEELENAVLDEDEDDEEDEKLLGLNIINKDFDSKKILNKNDPHDSEMKLSKNENLIKIPTRIQKLPKSNEEKWPQDFTPIKQSSDQINDIESQTDVSVPISDEIIVEYNSLPLSESLVIQEDIHQYKLTESNLETKYEHREPTIEAIEKKGEFHEVPPVLKPKKNKRKKKQKKTEGLDFWGFSSGNGPVTEEKTDFTPDSFLSGLAFSSTIINNSEAANQETVISGTIFEAVDSMVHAATRIPQRISTGINFKDGGYNFFDKVEDEIDLENDPILQRIQDNISNPNRTKSHYDLASSILLPSFSVNFNQKEQLSESSYSTDFGRSDSIPNNSSGNSTKLPLLQVIRERSLQILDSFRVNIILRMYHLLRDLYSFIFNNTIAKVSNVCFFRMICLCKLIDIICSQIMIFLFAMYCSFGIILRA